MISLQKNRVAVIFAGGKSSRMGRDKSLMPFRGYDTMAEYQYVRLSRIFKKVYISTKEAKFNFEAPLIYDKYPQSSPLVAIISLFENITEDECFILSVDSPFVDENIINRLYKEADNLEKHNIIAKSQNGNEPLCGVYNRASLKIAKEELERNNHRLNNLLAQTDTKFIYFADKEPFVNLNYIEDYYSSQPTL